MKSIFIVSVFVLTGAMLPLSSASAKIDASRTPNAASDAPKMAAMPLLQLAYHLISSPHSNEKKKEKQDSCTCGATPQCYAKKNQSWTCETDTGKPADCTWHPKGVCLPKDKDTKKDLHDGDDVSGKVFETN